MPPFCADVAGLARKPGIIIDFSVRLQSGKYGGRIRKRNQAELAETLRRWPATKSPGPDGWRPAELKDWCPEVRELVCLFYAQVEREPRTSKGTRGADVEWKQEPASLSADSKTDAVASRRVLRVRRRAEWKIDAISAAISLKPSVTNRRSRKKHRAARSRSALKTKRRVIGG